jgi:phosphomannomutase
VTLRESLHDAPVELAFGTSGLRGLVRDITHLEAAINTLGFLRYALRRGDVCPGAAVCVAGDLRPSTAERVPAQGGRGALLQAVFWAIENAGLRTKFLGRIPTPALMAFAVARGMASVMVTGSHIPFDRNGIKFNLPAGEVLKADEPPILQAVQTVRAELYNLPAADSAFDAEGMLKSAVCPALPEPDPQGAMEYRDRYLRAFPVNGLRGRRLLVFQHSAVGRDLLVEVLRALGADVVAAGRSEEFIPVDTEAVSAQMIEQLQALVDASGAPGVEAVVSTDGDSDRPLVLGVEGGRVRFFSGDLLGAVVAEFLGARHAAVPISTNDAVDQYLGARGVTITKTRIGSPHVIAALREVGWEANGGFLTARPLRIPGGGELAALPTRDAFLPILAALYSSLARGIPLSTRFAELPPRFGRSDLLRPCPREAANAIMARLAAPDPAALRVAFAPGRVIVERADGGRLELHNDAPEAQPYLERRRVMAELFPPTAGFGPVAWVNYLDGARIGFANGDVAHLRPSGNAPEFRVYANADSPARADAIVRHAIGDRGVIRRLAAGSGV